MHMNYVASIVFLVSVVGSIYLQQKSESIRVKDRSRDIGIDYLKRKRMPTFGFDAVVADLLWMRTNLRRSPKLVNDRSKTENLALAKRLAMRDFVGYRSVVSLDPTFRDAYHYAILRVMTDLPDKAISMSRLAIANSGRNELVIKRFAERAGHIASQVNRDFEEALEFYKICVRGGPEKPFMGRQYLRTLARVKGIDPHTRDLEELVKICKIYYQAHLDLLNEKASLDKQSIFRKKKNKGLRAVSKRETWVRPTLIYTIRNFLGRINQEEHKVSKQDIEEVQDIFKSLEPPPHLCSNCYMKIAAGDRFCANCGSKARLHGICSAENCDNVLKGPFCDQCGQKSKDSKTF